MRSWHVGYVKRSRPHVYLPRSPHHLQPISHVHFKRTAKHTNRDREPFGGFRGREVDRSMPIEGVNPFHVGSRIKGRPLHRTLRGERDHLQPISHVHFKRTAKHTNRDCQPFGGFRGREVDRSMPIEGVNPFHVGSRIKGRPLHRTLRGERDSPKEIAKAGLEPATHGL
jgi:hypothetical protein